MSEFDLQAHLDQLAQDGFTIVPGVLPTDMCLSLRQRLIAVAQQHRREEVFYQGVSFVPGVINYEQSFAEYLADGRVVKLAEALLGPNVRISFTSAIMNEPGKQRTKWHADWPFNQNNACHIPAPYPDQVMHLTALLMVSPFTEENGGALIVPGSHRQPSNPTDPKLGIDVDAPYPYEYRIMGNEGNMLMFDSRLWHCPPANPSDQVRVALGIRYAPWWLNLEVLDPDSDYRHQLVDEAGKKENIVPRLATRVYANLPEKVQPLYRHWLGRE